MFRSICAALAAFLVVLATTASPASSKNPKLCDTAAGVRAAVVKKHGKRAPGRNICRFGVQSKFNAKWSKPATVKQKAVYVRALRALNAPPPAFLAKTAALPALAPAGTLSARYAPSGLASCIVRHESGGNPLATNGQYHGIAQWSPEAWARHGGRRFAADPHGASYQEQLQVLSNGLARYGCRDWCPFDGC